MRELVARVGDVSKLDVARTLRVSAPPATAPAALVEPVGLCPPCSPGLRGYAGRRLDVTVCGAEGWRGASRVAPGPSRGPVWTCSERIAMGPMYDPRGDRVDASDAARAAAAVPTAGPLPSDPLVQVTRGLTGLVARYHRATLEGADRLPPGDALLVGDHGLYGFETFAFFYLFDATTGRFPVGLTDRLLFEHGPLARFSRAWTGTSDAPTTRATSSGAPPRGLLSGRLRAGLQAAGRTYRLRWERALGFARLSIFAGRARLSFVGSRSTTAT